jgi:hypothetical protein
LGRHAPGSPNLLPVHHGIGSLIAPSRMAGYEAGLLAGLVFMDYMVGCVRERGAPVWVAMVCAVSSGGDREAAAG